MLKTISFKYLPWKVFVHCFYKNFVEQTSLVDLCDTFYQIKPAINYDTFSSFVVPW